MPPCRSISVSDWDRIEQLLPGRLGQHFEVAEDNENAWALINRRNARFALAEKNDSESFPDELYPEKIQRRRTSSEMERKRRKWTV